MMTLRLILYLIVSEVERYKLEKKRERNRIAATKCRLRKMERISQLDGQVSITTMKFANLQTGFGSRQGPRSQQGPWSLCSTRALVHWSQSRLQSRCVLKLFDLVDSETFFDEKNKFSGLERMCQFLVPGGVGSRES